MRVKPAFWFLIFWAATETVVSNPVPERKFLYDGFLNKVKQFMENNLNQTTTYTVHFVPLITLLSEAFINFVGKYGQLNAFNQFPTNRNVTQQDFTTEQLPEENESTQQEDDAEEEDETELIECDANHVGLWPDKSNSQRFYKCEVDPRSPVLGNCLTDYFLSRKANKTNAAHSLEIVVPAVQPCFLLSLMKCANGFKYSHKTRICIPDVVFGSQIS